MEYKLVNGVRVQLTTAEEAEYLRESDQGALENAAGRAAADVERKRRSAARVLDEERLTERARDADAPQAVKDYVEARDA